MEIGIEKKQSVGDADVFTVKKRLEIAKHHQTTDVTEILVLLMYNWCSTMKDIMFATTKSLNKKKVNVEYSVRYLVNK